MENSPPLAAARAPIQWRSLILLCLIWSGLVVTEQISYGILSGTCRQFTQDIAVIGFILGLNRLFGFIANPIVGLISDKIWTPFGRRAVFLITGAPIVAIALLLIPSAGSLWHLIGLVVMYQFFQDVLWGSDHPLIADLIPVEQRSLAAGLMMASSQGVGYLFNQYGMGVIAKNHGENTLYYFAAAAQIALVCLPAFFLREVKRPLPPKTPFQPLARFDEHPLALRYAFMHRLAHLFKQIKSPALQRPAHIAAIVIFAVARYITDITSHPILRRFALLAFCSACFTTISLQYFRDFATTTLKIPVHVFGPASSIMSLIILFGAIPFGILVEKYLPKQRVMVGGYIIALAACLYSYFAQDADDIRLMAIGFACGQLVLNVTQKPFFTEYVPRDLIGQISGAYNICYAAGAYVGTVGTGLAIRYLFDHDLRMMWPLASFFALLSILIAATIPDVRYQQRKTGHTAPPIP